MYRARAYAARFGVIFSGFSIVLLVFGLLASLSETIGNIFALIILFFWLIALLLTLGSLLLSSAFRVFPGSLSLNGTSHLVKLLLSAAPVALWVSLALSAVSAALLLLEPTTHKRYGRMVAMIITAICSVVALVVTA